MAIPVIAVASAVREELIDVIRRCHVRRRSTHRGQRFLAGRLANRDVLLCCTGDGLARAQRGIAQLLDHFDVSNLVSIGVAGALTSDLEPGQIVVAGEVHSPEGSVALATESLRNAALAIEGVRSGTVVTVDRIVTEQAAKAELWQRLAGEGPAAVDMESSAVVQLATARRTPVLVARAICDTANEDLPSFLVNCANDDGSMHRGRVVLHALRHPSAIRSLLWLRRRVRRCSARLGAFVAELIPRLAPAVEEAR